MSIKAIKKRLETKRHEFSFPKESISGLLEKITVLYESRIEFIAKSQRTPELAKEGDYVSTRETLDIYYFFNNSERKFISFKVEDKRYSEVCNRFDGPLKHINKRVYTLLQRELPKYASMILPKK